MKTVKERLAFIEAEIKSLQKIVSNIDCKDGHIVIVLARSVANDVSVDLQELEGQWFREHKDEVPK